MFSFFTKKKSVVAPEQVPQHNLTQDQVDHLGWLSLINEQEFNTYCEEQNAKIHISNLGYMDLDLFLVYDDLAMFRVKGHYKDDKSTVITRFEKCSGNRLADSPELFIEWIKCYKAKVEAEQQRADEEFDAKAREYNAKLTAIKNSYL